MHIHILGICGTFMGGLALIARQAGHHVTGCDHAVYPPMSTQLAQQGIELIEGYDADQIKLAPDLFIIGNVVSRGNPLMEAILDQGLPYTSGPQWLGEQVLRHQHVLAVAGTHGKTTTSAMLAWILTHAGLKPNYLIGGVAQNFGISAHYDVAQPYFVIEADEYDTAFFDKRSKFVHYHPRTAILGNLEFDHADIFDDLAAIQRQFHHFVRCVPRSGQVIYPATDDALATVIAQGCWSEKVHLQDPQGWHYRLLAPAGYAFEVLYQNQVVATVEWSLIGQHNVHNALAAIAAAHHVGVSPQQAAEALAAFQGIKRRLELRATIWPHAAGAAQASAGAQDVDSAQTSETAATHGEDNALQSEADVAQIGEGATQNAEAAIRIYDDFAHHPTAIATTLEGLRHQVGNARILAVLEPRSNTMKLGTMSQRLPPAMAPADMIFCYNEQQGKHSLQWNAREVFADCPQPVQIHTEVDALVVAVSAAARPGDHILIMSNGGFGGFHDKLIHRLQSGA